MIAAALYVYVQEKRTSVINYEHTSSIHCVSWLVMTVGPFQPICGGTERIHLNVGIEWEYESHPTSPHVTMQFECALQSLRLGL